MLKIATAALLLLPLLAHAQTQQGEASYFNGGQSGHSKTASGAPVSPGGNTAASRTLPLGSEAKVTNQRTGQSTEVKVTDRGPTRGDRVIDVSKAAAGKIGMKSSAPRR